MCLQSVRRWSGCVPEPDVYLFGGLFSSNHRTLAIFPSRLVQALLKTVPLVTAVTLDGGRNIGRTDMTRPELTSKRLKPHEFKLSKWEEMRHWDHVANCYLVVQTPPGRHSDSAVLSRGEFCQEKQMQWVPRLRTRGSGTEAW